MLSLFVVLLCATTTTVLANRRGIRASGSVAAELLDSPESGKRNLQVGCTTPELLYYKADIQVSTYLPEYCSSSERDYVRQRINYHWNKYVAYNQVLGPIGIDHGGVCSGGRRHLAANETSPSGRRRLINWNYPDGGNCGFCGSDNSDDRRRRLNVATPVTFEVNTDKYPGEMSFQVYDQWGNRVISYSYFPSSYSTKTVTYDLNAGQRYTVKMSDGYGDGWCCSNGYGGMKVYDGNPGSGMDLIDHFSGNFGWNKNVEFVVPVLGVTARSAGYDNPADILFPELESKLSEWLSYYIQQEFHWRSGHCLRGKGPLVFVDLESTSPSGAASHC